ncbi:MAG: hypothetical protein ACREGD_03910 [Candidatus Saccharimonadales bacterium]
MTTFLLILLTILSGAGAGYLFGLLTGEEPGSDSSSDLFSEARQVWSDISADVQQAEEQIQRLSRPSPGRRPQQ